MTTQLAVGNSALASADFTVAAGATLVVSLIRTGNGSIGASASPISLELKTGSTYTPVDSLTPVKPAVVITGGAGITTYRVVRTAGYTDSVGVETQ
jgi:hypothetical protein